MVKVLTVEGSVELDHEERFLFRGVPRGRPGLVPSGGLPGVPRAVVRRRCRAQAPARITKLEERMPDAPGLRGGS